MARWALISGENGVENAARAVEVAERLAAGGARVAGYVQHKGVDERGRKRFEIVRLSSGERAVLAVHGVFPRPGEGERFCSMAFRNDGFATARRWIEEDAPAADLLVLDGISKLEVMGRGHSATLGAALRREGKLVLVCARASQLFYVVERFGLAEEDLVAALELPAAVGAADSFARAVAAALGCGAGA